MERKGLPPRLGYFSVDLTKLVCRPSSVHSAITQFDHPDLTSFQLRNKIMSILDHISDSVAIQNCLEANTSDVQEGISSICFINPIKPLLKCLFLFILGFIILFLLI